MSDNNEKREKIEWKEERNKKKKSENKNNEKEKKKEKWDLKRERKRDTRWQQSTVACTDHCEKAVCQGKCRQPFQLCRESKGRKKRLVIGGKAKIWSDLSNHKIIEHIKRRLRMNAQIFICPYLQYKLILLWAK